MFELFLAGLLFVSGSVLLWASFVSASGSAPSILRGSALAFFAMGSLLLLRLPTVQSSLPVVSKPDWTQGGSLHDASLAHWRGGDYANQLATAYDWLQDFRQAQIFMPPIRSRQEYRPWAAALLACLAQSQAAEGQAARLLAEQCVHGQGLKAWLP